MLERQWQTIALDIEEQNDILAKNALKYRQRIDETRYITYIFINLK
jgi:hypothetical protein